MDKRTPVSAIMTVDVITVAPDDTMDKVQAIFRDHEIHHIPVTENGKVVGIISESDYLRLQNSFSLFKTKSSEDYNDVLMRSLLVKEVMTQQVAKLRPDDTVALAAGFFRENLFRALPIVEPNGKLAGIVTTYDLLNFAFRD